MQSMVFLTALWIIAAPSVFLLVSAVSAAYKQVGSQPGTVREFLLTSAWQFQDKLYVSNLHPFLHTQSPQNFAYLCFHWDWVTKLNFEQSELFLVDKSSNSLSGKK